MMIHLLHRIIKTDLFGFGRVNGDVSRETFDLYYDYFLFNRLSFILLLCSHKITPFILN